MSGERKNAWVILEITSFRGVSFGAEHYYGKLIQSGSGWETAEIKIKLTKRQAEKLSKKDDWEYREGSTVTRFDTEKEIIDIALKTYKTRFPNATILLCGSPTTAEPIKPIDGPIEFMEQAERIFKEYDAFEWVSKRGFYDRRPEDRPRIDELTREWMALLATQQQAQP